MQTIQSRAYTNVILTVIALLLAVLAIGPYVQVNTPAWAQIEPSRPRNIQQTAASGDEIVGRATESVARATQDIAQAIREAAKSQQAIADALLALGEGQ